MSPDTADHLPRAPTADPGDLDPLRLRTQLDTACAVRHAIHDGLCEATNAFRDAMAARPLDALRLARARGDIRRLDDEWCKQAAYCSALRERWEDARWRQRVALAAVAA
jgi:hypothetical protein